MKEQIKNNKSLDPSLIQGLASDPDKSVYVSASAGTGKTKVLTDRFIRLMLAGYPAKNILCLTFTNAATREMRDRIYSKLKSWSKLDDENLADEIFKLTKQVVTQSSLKNAKTLFYEFESDEDDLNILTIHGFSQKILSRIGISKYDNEIISDQKRRFLINCAISNVIESDIESLKYEIMNLYQNFEHGYIKDILKTILDNKFKFLNFYGPSKDEELKSFFLNIHGTEREFDIETEEKKVSADFKQKIYEVLIEMVELGSKSAEKLNFNLKEFSFDDIFDALYTKQNTLKKLFTKKEFEVYGTQVQLINESIESFHKFVEDRKKLICARLNTSLAVVGKRVLGEYKKYLKDNKLMEFSDIIEYAREIIYEDENADNILYKLDYTIDHILVDEAQDLSLIQWELIKKVSEEFFSGYSSRLLKRTMFVVGDFKQSICGFQGASPEVFLSIYEFYKEKLKAIGDDFYYIDMQVSFRSTATIIDAVNLFFKNNNVTENFIDHISYKGGEGAVTCFDLIPKAKKAPIEGWVIPKLEDQIIDEKNKCAEEIAEKIKCWLDNYRAISGTNKAISPGDIMIILKKREPMMSFLNFHLRNKGVAVQNPDKINFSDSLLINDFVCLARFADYPYDDIALATILKSPIFALSNEDFHKVCIKNTEKKLFDRIQDIKIKNKLELIYSCKKIGIKGFYGCLEKELGLKLIYLKKYGEECLVDLSNFMGFINSIEKQDPFISLAEFVKLSQDPELKIENNSPADQDKVRILTVHGSKGLQAPVVILGDSSSSISKLDHFIWSDNIPFLNISKHNADSKTLMLKDELKKIEKNEDMRLLYVAMTRAENELHFAGVEGKGVENSWYSKFKDIDFQVSIEEKIGDLKEDSIKNKSSFYIEDLESKETQENEFSEIASSKFDKYTTGARFGNYFHHYIDLISKVKNYKNTEFNNALQESAYNKAMEVKCKFPDLFTEQSKSELSLVGNENGKKFLYKIDKVIFENNEIIIVDYKVDLNIPKNKEEVKDEYMRQLKRYASKISSLYPNKKIIAKILWVNEMKLMYLFEL